MIYSDFNNKKKSYAKNKGNTGCTNANPTAAIVVDPHIIQ